MKWHCPKCRFSWTGNMDVFYQVKLHEKSHKIKNARKPTLAKLKKNQASQKLRIKVKKAARRSGKSTSKESKVAKSKTKRNLIISQKRTATVKKSRY